MSKNKTAVEVTAEETTKKAPPAWILGKRPETLSDTVKIPVPGGEPVEVEMHFQYRTATEFGKLQDDIQETIKSTVKWDEGETFSYESSSAKAALSNAKSTLLYLKGWELPGIDLSQDALEQLYNESPAASHAIFDVYARLIQGARRGN